MRRTDPVIRTANSLSLAAWFGGSLMGFVGLPRAADDGEAPTTRAEGRAWSAWQPVQAGAIVSQLASGAALTLANRGRLVGQRGVASTSIARTALTGAAIGATALAARSGRRLEGALDGAAPSPHQDAGDARPVAATETTAGAVTAPSGPAASDDVAGLRRRTRALQASVPLLTGALIALDAVMGEQQRPRHVVRGTARRVLPDPVADRIPA
jgi:hypothetical protein